MLLRIALLRADAVMGFYKIVAPLAELFRGKGGYRHVAELGQDQRNGSITGIPDGVGAATLN